jgi:hypothetical protein
MLDRPRPKSPASAFTAPTRTVPASSPGHALAVGAASDAAESKTCTIIYWLEVAKQFVPKT